MSSKFYRSYFCSLYKIIFILFFVLASCSQNRSDYLPEEEQKNIFSIQELSRLKLKINVQNIHLQAEPNLEYSQASLESKHLLNLPKHLVSLFEQLNVYQSISSFNSKSYHSDIEISLSISPKKLYVFQSIANMIELRKSSLSALEIQKDKILLATYDIQKYGRLENKKNSSGKESHILGLSTSSWTKATHILVDTAESKRVLPIQKNTEQQSIYHARQWQGQVYSAQDLQKKFKIHLPKHEPSLSPSAEAQGQVVHYRIKIQDQKLILFEQIRNWKNKLNFYTLSEQQAMLDFEKQQATSIEVQRCSEFESISECLEIEKYYFNVQYLQQSLEYDENQQATGRLTFISSSKQDWIQFNNIAQVYKARNSSLNSPAFDSQNSLVLSNYANKIFYYRSFLQKSSAQLDFSFPGLATKLELIRFEFLPKSVKLIQVKNFSGELNSSTLTSNTSIGSRAEESMLLEFPVLAYVKAEVSQEQGVAYTRYVDSDYKDPKAIAIVDWSKSKWQQMHTVYQYFKDCLASEQNSNVLRVNQFVETKNQEQNLDISIQNEFEIFPNCLTQNNDYNSRDTSNYFFQQLISIKEYKKELRTNLAIPYSAQKILGFGFFTYNKWLKETRGNNRREDRISYPSVFDFQNQNILTYRLHGLDYHSTDPEQIAQNKKIIDAVQSVIDDANLVLSKAFKHSKLARDSAYIQLITNPPNPDTEIGSLNENLIYLHKHANSSSIIGMGGPSTNVADAYIDFANVHIYLGNIENYLKNLEDKNAAIKDYQSNAFDTLELDVFQKKNIVNEDEAIIDMGPNSNLGINTQVDTANSIDSQYEGFNDLNRTHESKLSTDNFAQAFFSNHLIPVSSLQASKDIQLQMFKKLYNQDFLNNNENDQRLVASIYKIKQQKQLRNSLIKNEFCNYDLSSIQYRNFIKQKKQNKTSKKDLENNLYIEILKSTLAHEIGHNLGMRHNFMASYDKNNYLKNESGQNIADYSSVMDYHEDSAFSYKAFGPYDIAALRFAYTGFLELDKKRIDQIGEANEPNLNSIVSSARHNLVHINFVKNILGLDSWDDLSDRKVDRLPLKNYMYCSDEDLWQQPNCQIFDKGSSPVEVVQNYIKDYRQTYALRNISGIDLEFSKMNELEYLSDLYYRFLKIRQYLEESYYLSLNTSSWREYGSHLEDAKSQYSLAVQEALVFFNSVIGQAELSRNANWYERFSLLPVSSIIQLSQDDPLQKKSIPIELKYLKNQQRSVQSQDLLVRGIEFDKALALIMLTHNKMPWPRYQDSNIKVSFLDFEASIPNIDKRRLPSLQILLSVLMDQVKPIGLRAKTGEYFNLPHTYIASTNEFLRSVATHSASIALGQSKDSPNFSDAFMMLAGWQKNPKFLNVLEPRAELDQSSKLKLWLSPDYYSSFQIGIQVEKNRVFDLYQKEILVYSFQSLQKNKSLKYLNQNFVERILQESFPLISSEELERKLNDANQWKSQSLDLKKSFQSLELIINIVLDLEKLREEIMEGNSSYTMHDFETQILYGRLNYIKYLMKNDILLAHMFHSLQWSEQLPSARLIRMNTDPMAYWSMLYNHLLQMYRNFKEQRPEL